MNEPIYENIPEDLKALRRWVLYRSEKRTDNGRLTKVPYQLSGAYASTNDPTTWSSYAAVVEALPGYDGIGFVLSQEDDIVGIDLDNCRCPAFDNVVLPWAEEIIAEIGSYTEVSPSGKGIRIFVKGGPLPSKGRKKGPVEIYDSGRYLTVTGWHVPSTPKAVESRREAVLKFHHRFFGNGSQGPALVEVLPPVSDQEVDERLKKAFSSGKGEKIRQLYDGDWSPLYPSQSEADLALCAHLAPWMDNNPAMLDCAFRRSCLMRPKWDERHSLKGRTYGQITITKVIDRQEDAPDSQAGDPSPGDSDYFVDPEGCWFRRKPTRHGRVPERIANFTAKIEEEILEDDGVETSCRYVIVGQSGGRRLPVIDVPASTFPGMGWAAKWGSQAIIEPGQSKKDYVRHAIQVSSPRVRKSTCFTHTGWRLIDGNWAFLTARGGIGAEGVTVKLSPEMSRYALPLRPENEEEAIRASLSFLDIGSRDVTLPLFAMAYLAPLTSLLDPMPNFSGYLYGPTGTFKTTLVLLLLSHYGDFSTVANLPNLDDTANSLEKRAFVLKDCLMPLDDYHPSPRRADSQNKENIAQRIIRAYSNRTARGRLNSDTSDKGRYTPRGYLLVTGEEIVSLQSTLARVFVVETHPGDIDMERLTQLQARAHLLPHAMTSFILWVREHIDTIRETFPSRFGDLREQSFRTGFHLKVPEQIAYLRLALETAIGWMIAKGVISEDEARKLAEEGWEVFTRLSQFHSRRILDENPITMFDDIMRSLILQRKVCIEHRTVPGKDIGSAEGTLIGCYDDRHLYLFPTAMWHELNRFCMTEGTNFPCSKRTFYKMLRDRKLIEPDVDGQNTTTVNFKGSTERVLKFIAGGMFQFAVIGVIDESCS